LLSRAGGDETMAILYLGTIAALRGHMERAARFLGFADALLERMPLVRDPLQERAREILIASLRKSLSEESIAALASKGAKLTVQQVTDEARA
jgi:hypothetical protein